MMSFANIASGRTYTQKKKCRGTARFGCVLKFVPTLSPSASSSLVPALPQQPRQLSWWQIKAAHPRITA